MPDSFTPLRGKATRLHPTPPYISFLRFKAFVQSLRQSGIPERLGIEFFEKLPAGDRRQLQTALQYLQLIDAFWRPTAHLPALVGSYGTDGWPGELSCLLLRAYSPLLGSNLPLASQDDLQEAFRQVYEGTDDVLRKSRTFFLHAAHEANLDLDPAIFSGIKPRMSQTRRQRAGGTMNAESPDDPWAASAPIGYRPSRPDFAAMQPSDVLLELWDTDKMTGEEVRAVQTLLKYCKRQRL